MLDGLAAQGGQDWFVAWDDEGAQQDAMLPHFIASEVRPWQSRFQPERLSGFCATS
jgi:hypothetical protein